jgi:hypothetical protein
MLIAAGIVTFACSSARRDKLFPKLFPLKVGNEIAVAK